MISQLQKQLCSGLADIVDSALPEVTEMSVYRMAPRGLITTPQWFVDVPNLSAGHPFDGMKLALDNRFVNELCTMRAVTLDEYTNSTGKQVSTLASTRHQYGATSLYANYSPQSTPANELAFTDTLVSQTLEAYYSNFNIIPESNVGAPNAYLGKDGLLSAATTYEMYYFQLASVVQATFAPYSKTAIMKRNVVQPGHYASLALVTAAANKDVTACLKMMPLDDTVVDQYGYLVHEWEPTLESSLACPLPFVRGLSRRYMILGAATVSSKRTIIGYYVYGEDRDMVAYNYTAVQNDGFNKRYTNWTGVKKLVQPVLSATDSIKLSGYVTYHKMYPASWNKSLMERVDVSNVDISDTPDILKFGNMTVKYYTITLDVNFVLGSLTRDHLVAYLEDGYGVFPPASEEKVELVKKSWMIATDIAVRMEAIPVSGYSIKQTDAYNEYGRKRKKACKDNNYLELPYNDEYVMKTVENKLTALTGLNVIAADRSLIGAFKSSRHTVVTGATLVTISKSPEGIYTYSSTKGQTGVLSNEASITAMMEATMPARFTGEVDIIQRALADAGETAAVADINADMQQQNVSSSSLKMEDLDLPELSSFNVMKAKLSRSQQIAFLAAQVTDYAQFNQKYPLLLQTLSGEGMMTKLLLKLVEKGVIADITSVK